MAAYYNENDKYAAQWLRNLIAAGHLPDGVVDDRSIEDVHADELREFDFGQAHAHICEGGNFCNRFLIYYPRPFYPRII